MLVGIFSVLFMDGMQRQTVFDFIWVGGDLNLSFLIIIIFNQDD